MLVLTRFEEQSIFIDGNKIIIKILEVIPSKSGNQFKVRVGIKAPKGMSVHREEIYYSIEKSGGVMRKKDKVAPLDREGNK